MKRNNIFWIGYSDLMTSLFFVMLVLFVVSIAFLNNKMRENEALIAELKERESGLIEENERLEKLLNLEKQFKPLIDDNKFYYLPECKKFIVKDFMGVEIFEPNETIIKKDFMEKTLAAGQKIEEFLGKLYKKNEGFSYLLLIEGNMANKWDKSISEDSNWGYLTSYKRALAVYDLWERQGVNFRQYDVEVMLCGSGFNGLCRDEVEENNKRFSIQIIPKVSK